MINFTETSFFLKDHAPFLIYNASAGSGKTFALVKSYLTNILSSPQKDGYKYLLAITFTNKAVAEMKQRIVQALIDFSEEKTPTSATPMLEMIASETKIAMEEIKKRAKNILNHLLNHYSLFSIETIDRFNLRLLRTFSRDLQLPPNFEVHLDSSLLISKAIDNLLEKAGDDVEITAFLVAFALQKTDEDKSWDISIDLNKMAALLALENELPYLEKLRSKPLVEFKKLQSHLLQGIEQQRNTAKKEAKQLLDSFSKEGLNRSHFSGGHSFDFFVSISEGNLDLNFETAWQQNLGQKPLYKVKEESSIKEAMDTLDPVIFLAFQTIKEAVFKVFLYQNILKNLVPLATLHLIHLELQALKEEENVLPIFEFNQIIGNSIKNEPAPFIYERLGERYRHFFIDEFQDTSYLQWHNLLPLIENALSQQYNDETSGSLLLVGDAKQSIYRWRGGLPEQFISLWGEKNPFPSATKELRELQTNYRSCKEIVQFNNRFFSYIAAYFGNTVYQDIYKIGNRQIPHKSCEGFISLQFIENSAKEEAYEGYVQKVLETIQELEQRGCPKNAICVLTRKREEGIAVSEFLAAHGIAVTSEETLLLQNSEKIQALIHLLTLSLFPDREDSKVQLLDFLHGFVKSRETKHAFFSRQIGKPLTALEEMLRQFSVILDLKKVAGLSLFESFEYLIHQLGFSKEEDPFLWHFMDWVFQYSKKNTASKHEFLTVWELEKEKASISISQSSNSVTVMTIHKAKGLEFPVVIFPFADLDIYREIDPKTWYPWGKDGFEDVLINYSSQIEHYGEKGGHMVQERKNTLELDNFNLLYVALTRAEKELYVFAQNEKEQAVPKKYNAFLKGFLQKESLWEDGLNQYTWGEKLPWDIHEMKPPITAKMSYRTLLPFETLLNYAPSKNQFYTREMEDASVFGNWVHDTLAKIKTLEDYPSAIEEMKDDLENPEEILAVQKAVEMIIHQPKLHLLFSGRDTVHNEKEILSADGIFRPDRLNIHSDASVTVLDYKTGAQKESHKAQINAYAQLLLEMGYSIRQKLIVYIQKEGVLINNV
ncbi:MAG: UvrD-helicase domain-containing protein [Flavobacteriaceae bacterium]